MKEISKDKKKLRRLDREIQRLKSISRYPVLVEKKRLKDIKEKIKQKDAERKEVRLRIKKWPT